VLVGRGELIDERSADLIDQAAITAMRIRSPLIAKQTMAFAQCAMAVIWRVGHWSTKARR
jgi:hypothetical protein